MPFPAALCIYDMGMALLLSSLPCKPMLLLKSGQKQLFQVTHAFLYLQDEQDRDASDEVSTPAPLDDPVFSPCLGHIKIALRLAASFHLSCMSSACIGSQ